MVKWLLVNNSELESKYWHLNIQNKEGFNSAIGDFYVIALYIF